VGGGGCLSGRVAGSRGRFALVPGCTASARTAGLAHGDPGAAGGGGGAPRGRKPPLQGPSGPHGDARRGAGSPRGCPNQACRLLGLGNASGGTPRGGRKRWPATPHRCRVEGGPGSGEGRGGGHGARGPSFSRVDRVGAAGRGPAVRPGRADLPGVAHRRLGADQRPALRQCAGGPG